jgi:hypothetical protein
MPQMSFLVASTLMLLLPSPSPPPSQPLEAGNFVSQFVLGFSPPSSPTSFRPRRRAVAGRDGTCRAAVAETRATRSSSSSSSLSGSPSVVRWTPSRASHHGRIILSRSSLSSTASPRATSHMRAEDDIDMDTTTTTIVEENIDASSSSSSSNATMTVAGLRGEMHDATSATGRGGYSSLTTYLKEFARDGRARFGRKSLSKLGMSALLAYGFVSNVSGVLAISSAWFVFCKRVSSFLSILIPLRRGVGKHIWGPWRVGGFMSPSVSVSSSLSATGRPPFPPNASVHEWQYEWMSP